MSVTRQAIQESLMVWHDVAIDVSLRREQRRNRHDEADRLNVAEPFLMGDVFWVF